MKGDYGTGISAPLPQPLPSSSPHQLRLSLSTCSSVSTKHSASLTEKHSGGFTFITLEWSPVAWQMMPSSSMRSHIALASAVPGCLALLTDPPLPQVPAPSPLTEAVIMHTISIPM